MKKKAAKAKPAKKTAPKRLSKAQALARLRANAKAYTNSHASVNRKGRVVRPNAVKRTLSLNDRHVATWRDRLMKLGRNKPYAVADKPRLELDKYLGETAAPAVVDFASEILTWPMYRNDSIGDCTAACVGHEIQAWTRYTGAEVTVTEDEIVQLYSAVSGYDPSTGANDDGAVIQDVLTYWRKSGVPVAGHKILAFAQLQDLSKVKDALWMFGSVYLGINCPESALQQFDNDQPWTVIDNSPIAGGHAIPLQYAGEGAFPYQVVTWGKLQGMDQAFFNAFVEEAWVVITDDWLDKNGHTPEGLNLQALGQDLADLTGDPDPFPAPQPPAPPVPTPAPPDPPAPVPVPTPPPAPKPDIKGDLDKLEADFIQTVKDVEQVL